MLNMKSGRRDFVKGMTTLGAGALLPGAERCLA
jgi:TAT (twin-arginine translocation) pathway signal sequence